MKPSHSKKKPLFLSKAYFPSHEENRMSNEGDVEYARAAFLRDRPGNLAFLLRKRYSWMNDFIAAGDQGIEIGCGTGLSKEYVHKGHYLLTDVVEHDWVEKKVDAQAMPFEDSSVDFIISSNMIHHLPVPLAFFDECARVLRRGGRLIIQDINSSLVMRALLRLMRHEGYSYDVDVFDRKCLCNNPSDPWSANCAIPLLLFDDIRSFEQHTSFQVIHHKLTEFLVFPLSGGVIAKTSTVNLPAPVLKGIDILDNLLIRLLRNVFPLQMQVVLKNVKSMVRPMAATN